MVAICVVEFSEGGESCASASNAAAPAIVLAAEFIMGAEFIWVLFVNFGRIRAQVVEEGISDEVPGLLPTQYKEKERLAPEKDGPRARLVASRPPSSPPEERKR